MCILDDDTTCIFFKVIDGVCGYLGLPRVVKHVWMLFTKGLDFLTQYPRIQT